MSARTARAVCSSGNVSSTAGATLPASIIGDHRVARTRRAAEVVMSAITLHRSPDVHRGDGAVAYLLAAGAARDATGRRVWDLPPASVDAVVDRHPRPGFRHEFARLVRAEGGRVPAGRVRFLERHAAYHRAIQRAPLPDLVSRSAPSAART